MPHPLTAALTDTIGALARAPVGGYATGGDPASEPTAWSALALAALGEAQAAREAADWIAQLQAEDGSVGVTASEAAPGWPTSLALLAWSVVDAKGYQERIEGGANWLLAQEPWTAERTPVFGHDTTLEGWSWAPATHSWLEPTATATLALRRTGHADHPRASQAARLLVDRLLPSGGANYGNTVVLGQELLQHLQPSGVVALALAAEGVTDERFDRTLDYLAASAARPTGAASLAYAALGLAANGRGLDGFAAPLADAASRALAAGGVYKPALVALALHAIDNPQHATAFTREDVA